MRQTDFEGELQCELNGEHFTVSASRERVIVASSRIHTLFFVVKEASAALRQFRLNTSDLAVGLGAPVEFQVDQRTLARLTAGETSGLSRLLGWPPLRLHPIAIVRTVLRGFKDER